MHGEQGGAPTPQPSDQPQPQPESREYTLSEAAKASIWAELARITPALSKPAAAVLTWLTAEALRNGSTSIRASCRDISAGTGWSKQWSINATKALVETRLIAKREGTATRPAAYLLRFAETLRMGGLPTRPPVESFPHMRVVHPVDQVVQPLDHLNEENLSLFETAPGVLSIDSRFTSLSEYVFDRSGDSLPIDPANAKTCSGLMQYFVRDRLRWVDPHPPDKKILAVMIRIAEWPAIENFLVAMIKKRDNEIPRNIGSPYAWLVTVAINQIHGIAAAEQKPTLELLRGGKQLYTRWHTEGLK